MEESVYQHIENVRRYKKLSYDMLAKMSGLTKSGLYEGMKNKTLKLSTYIKICKALEINPFNLDLDNNTPVKKTTASKDGEDSLIYALDLLKDSVLIAINTHKKSKKVV